MVVSSKNGISSYEMGRALGVTHKSAWFMDHHIRLAMQSGSFRNLSDHFEADETYIGGKARSIHKDKRAVKVTGTGGMGKAAVMGLLERHGPDGHSIVQTRVVPNVRRSVLTPVVRAQVEPGAVVYTAASKSDNDLRIDYVHQVTDHPEAYADGQVHTNGLENFWSLLKRGLRGTYISVEPYHLFRYLDEQVYRFNKREYNDRERFIGTMQIVVGRRLTWKQVTGQTGA
jgi:transposase-like protein